MTHDADSALATAQERVALVIELGQLRTSVLHGVRMLAETVIVPSLLLYAGMHLVGLYAGLGAVLVWCALSIGGRWVRGAPVPGTLLLTVGVLIGRTSLALVLSSVYVYLLEPVVGSVLMAVLFLGSAILGRPVTARLAQDFVKLPRKLLADHRMRRLFAQVSLMWGASRVLDAVMSLALLRWGIDAGLLSRGALSVILTLASIGLCAWWGCTRVRRIPGVEIRTGAPAA